MRILYDHQVFSMMKFGGVPRYFSEILKHFPKEDQYEVSLIFSDNYYLHRYPGIVKKLDILPGKEFKGKFQLRKKLSVVNKWYTKHKLNSNKFDVFHPTFYDDYYFSHLRKPFVVTVHDLIEVKIRPESAERGIHAQMEKAIRKANRIIAVSENTKRDIVELYDISPDKIDVIHHGYEKKSPIKADPSAYPPLPGNYLLFVGTRSSYKNFIPFVSAISSLLNRQGDLELLCVGDPFNSEEKDLFARMRISKQVRLFRDISDDFLGLLYANARAFVYPSKYEGFGMPILEAFENECPVCLSDASCFPEIAGDAGQYFNPDDAGSMLSAVEQVLSEPGLRNQLIASGKKRLEKFSWTKAAEKTLETYRKALQD